MTANKVKLQAEDAWALASSASKVVVSRGKKLETFDMKAGAADRESVLKAILGPTGNLRAPTIRKGKTLYVGFNEEAYLALVK